MARPVDAATQVPPHNVNAEAAFLGTILVAPDKLWRVSISEEHFYNSGHQRILRAILALAERGDRIDLVTTEAELARQARPGEPPIRYSDLDAIAERDSIVVEEHFAVLESTRRRRELFFVARQAMHLAVGVGFDFERELAALLDRLPRVQGAGDTRHLERLSELLSRRATELAERPAEMVEGLRTGFAAFDDLGGFPRGELIVVAGRPGMGKSAIGHAIATHVACAGGRVLLCTPEMHGNQVADRLLSQGADVGLLPLRRGRLSHEEWGRVATVAATAPPSLYVYDAGEMTTADIEATARRLALEAPLSLIIVDHLQYLADPAARNETRTNVVGRMAQRLKGLGRRLGAVMLVLSQLNRESEKRSDKRPELANLRDSGSVEQDADMVVLLHRPGYYDPQDHPGLAELLFAKFRNGPMGIRKWLAWDATTTRFFDVQHATNGQEALR